ncbi:MAG: DNA-binding protein [Clostridia bacterium]|nr:DNA-binding protein [Clostridia bacterium]
MSNTTPRMRTIKAAIAELKEIDSGTSFTESALRRAVRSGALPHIRAGNKILVNFDTLQQYLSGQLVTDTDALSNVSCIRRVG